ncbi:hypothetical protein QU661_01865 [Mogibacterium neglectum]|uniref:hypothetical protein n=1 Tax=Mogibacterium neglectum TaxID=114528 RepID=UPI00272C8956|nr:hypothetical protein [Mogibacterium neglectum]WLD76612.1 hypothetical protein QU661_01865 [Mogibacterium neglectum]
MKKSKALAIAIAIVLALPVLSIYGSTKLGHSNEHDAKPEQYHGVYYRNTLIRKYKHYSSYKRSSSNVKSAVDGTPITPDRFVTFRAYVTGDTLGYRVKKNASINNGFANLNAVDALNKRMTGNIPYTPLFINDINNKATDSVVLNGEKGKVQHLGFRAVYTAEEYEVKVFEQKTGKLIGLSHYKLYRPVYGEFALLDDGQ